MVNQWLRSMMRAFAARCDDDAAQCDAYARMARDPALIAEWSDFGDRYRATANDIRRWLAQQEHAALVAIPGRRTA